MTTVIEDRVKISNLVEMVKVLDLMIDPKNRFVGMRFDSQLNSRVIIEHDYISVLNVMGNGMILLITVGDELITHAKNLYEIIPITTTD